MGECFLSYYQKRKEVSYLDLADVFAEPSVHLSVFLQVLGAAEGHGALLTLEGSVTQFMLQHV